MPFLQRTPPGQGLLIGMVHLPALPGTPGSDLAMPAIIRQAAEEARQLESLGFDALLIENMHDRPYLKGGTGPEIVAHMTAVACAIRAAVQIPCGVQVLAAANREAIAVAAAAGLEFIRAEGFVYGHVADEGYIDGCAGDLLRFRRSIGAEGVAVFADIKKKHASHSITADTDIADTARAAAYNLADGLIVTGSHTGVATDATDLSDASGATDIPVLAGSGVTDATVASIFEVADGAIVGSYLKEVGDWERPLDPERCRRLVEAARVA